MTAIWKIFHEKVDFRLWGKKNAGYYSHSVWWDLQTQVDKNWFSIFYFAGIKKNVCKSIKIQFLNIFKTWIVIIVWFYGTFRDEIKDFKNIF